jgi:hypothetical protein
VCPPAERLPPRILVVCWPKETRKFAVRRQGWMRAIEGPMGRVIAKQVGHLAF